MHREYAAHLEIRQISANYAARVLRRPACLGAIRKARRRVGMVKAFAVILSIDRPVEVKGMPLRQLGLCLA